MNRTSEHDSALGDIYLSDNNLTIRQVNPKDIYTIQLEPYGGSHHGRGHTYFIESNRRRIIQERWKNRKWWQKLLDTLTCTGAPMQN